MLSAYIDESYSDNGFYYVGVLVVSAKQRHCIRLKLDALAEQVSADYGVPSNAEFHGHDLFQYKDDWSCLAGKHRVAAGIYNAALSVIADCGGNLFFHGLDTVRQRQRYGHNAFPPHVVALQYVLEEVNRFAIKQGMKVQVVADQVPDQVAHENRINWYKQVGTMGYKRSMLDAIEMPFMWDSSKSHRNLQAIDMATFVFRRSDSHEEVNEFGRKAMARLLETTMRATIHRRVWYP